MKTCAHCHHEGKPVDLMPYYFRGDHVWLHPRCSPAWHEAHR